MRVMPQLPRGTRGLLLGVLCCAACHRPPCDVETLQAGLGQPGPAGAALAVLDASGDRLPVFLGERLLALVDGMAVPSWDDSAQPLWQETCPGIGLTEADTAPLLDYRRRLHGACGHVLGVSEDALVTAVGDPVLAVLVHRWLVDSEIEPTLALRAAHGILGASAWDLGEAVELVSSAHALAAANPQWSLDGQGLHELAPSPGDPVVLLRDLQLPLPAIQEALEQLAEPSSAVRWVVAVPRDGKEDQLGTLALHRRDAASPSLVELTVHPDGLELRGPAGRVMPLPGCPVLGPSVCSELLAQDPTALANALTPLLDQANDGLSVRAPRGMTASALLALLDDIAWVPSARAFLGAPLPTCAEPLAGMACVPGGRFVVGDDDVRGNPAREISMSTFYLDREEVSAERYQGCVSAGFCRPRRTASGDEPVQNLGFDDAMRFCAWSGKRLPTEWEWEAAVRGPWGEPWPWGTQELSCDRALHRGCEAGQAADAQRYGLRNMVGSVAEWTASWAEKPLGSRGEACDGLDPTGVCGGAYPCRHAGARILRGASQRSSAGSLNSSARRASAESAVSDAGVRCASSEPVLTRWPPNIVREPLPVLGLPEPPSPEQIALASGFEVDDLGTKEVCGEDVRQHWGDRLRNGGRSTTECRDTYSYVVTNEQRAHLFLPFVVNQGGGYVGVGSEQSYDFIAASRARWAWVVDYDPNVIRAHKVFRAFVLASDTPAAFVAHFDDAELQASLDLLQISYPDDPDLVAIQRVFTGYRGRMRRHLQAKLEPLAEAPQFGWLAQLENYLYVRALFEQGRLNAVPGDLLAAGTMRNIAAAAHSLGVPIRVYYTTNAPTAWGGKITQEYRDNVLSLPFDERSVVIATMSLGKSYGRGFGQTDYWHYNVMDASLQQRRLADPGYYTMWQLHWDRIPSSDGDLTTCGLRSE